ncbi:hypothetical protein [Variovorax rhizosphaerae]|uniref:Uncharacterized protein n=1 Tax=Variovorax rhizosphaerae TaxID=1836200 RepID=A0ABU8WYW7_9BURK
MSKYLVEFWSKPADEVVANDVRHEVPCAMREEAVELDDATAKLHADAADRLETSLADLRAHE